jgi:hypothetical protein
VSLYALIAVLALLAVLGMTVALRQLIGLAMVLAESRREQPERGSPPRRAP